MASGTVSLSSGTSVSQPLMNSSPVPMNASPVMHTARTPVHRRMYPPITAPTGMAAVSRTRWSALSQASFSMTVPAISGTATREMMRATPTRNCAMFEDRNALEVYRKDASSGWTACLSIAISTRTRRTPNPIMK